MQNIKLSKNMNIRDLGTIASNDIIKEKMLIRGCSLDQITEVDKQILYDEYHLRTIIDLRTTNESKERPDAIIPGVNYFHIPIFDEDTPGITHLENEKDIEYKVDMKNLYREILKGKYLEQIAKVIRTIITMSLTRYSILFHCTEGKDRTGIITAILLIILGIDRKTIIDDYLYTNKINTEKAEKEYMLVLSLTKSEEIAENVKNLYLAKLEYLEVLFEVIDKEWGSIEPFVENGLHITESEISSFRNTILKNISN